MSLPSKKNTLYYLLIKKFWTSLVIQDLRICLNDAGDSGLIPGQKTRIPLAVGQLSPCAATTEPVLQLESMRRNERFHMMQ